MTDAVSIIKALGGNVHTGMCKCPAHDDKTPSLHVSEKNGRVLWHCHAGCSKERVTQALIDKGLWSKKRTTTQTSARKPQGSDQHDATRARKKAKAEANRRWKEAKPASPRHAYCQRKGVRPTGLKMENWSDGDVLLVPMYDQKGKLRNLHQIHENGEKHSIKGGPAKAMHYWIKKPSEVKSKTICIAEGWATGKSAHDATSYAAIMTFGKANLSLVANWVRRQHPDYKIILLADDDGGDGIEKANQAARAVNGLVAAPEFGSKRQKDDKDFNDLARVAALDEVKRQIDAAVKPQIDNGQRLDQLASLESIQYDQERKKVSEELGIRLATLDQEVEKRRAKAREARKHQVEEVDVEALAKSAASIIECENVLQLFTDECSKVIAGEESLLQLLYLSGTSRLFQKAMHVAIKGPSAGGKSEARKRVLSYFPRNTYSALRLCPNERCSMSRTTSNTKSCQWVRPSIRRKSSSRITFCAN